MRRLALAAVLAAALAPPSGARGDPAAAGGRIETDAGTAELLGRPVKAGQRFETPEGYLVVEEDGPDDGEVGSFSVVPAETFAASGAAAAASGEVATSGDPAQRPQAKPDCRPQRSAYLRELWRQAGIDVKDPDAVIEGLEAGSTGPATGFAWFALSTDAFRPLAWSTDLKDKAEALARCVRGP